MGVWQRAECVRLLPAVAHGLRGVRDPAVHYPPEQVGKVVEEMQQNRGVNLLGAPV